jgi:hypothetical protein
VGRLWTLLPDVDAATLVPTRKAIFNSLMAIMLQDLALLTPIIDDIVHLLKCMLLIEEFQGHPAAANGCPRLAIFRTVEAYVRPMASGAVPKEQRLLEMRLATPSQLSRCQGMTAGLLAQVLRLDNPAWTMRCLGHQSTTALWKLVCAQLVARNTSGQVRTMALKLISTQLLTHPASSHAYQRALLAILHLCEHLFKSKSGPPAEESLVYELQRALRRLVSAAGATAGFASGVHVVYAALIRIIGSFPCHPPALDGLWYLRRTVLWCLPVVMAMAPRLSSHGSVSITHLWGADQLASEVTACHVIILGADFNARCAMQSRFESAPSLRAFKVSRLNAPQPASCFLRI